MIIEFAIGDADDQKRAFEIRGTGHSKGGFSDGLSCHLTGSYPALMYSNSELRQLLLRYIYKLVFPGVIGDGFYINPATDMVVISEKSVPAIFEFLEQSPDGLDRNRLRFFAVCSEITKRPDHLFHKAMRTFRTLREITHICSKDDLKTSDVDAFKNSSKLAGFCGLWKSLFETAKVIDKHTGLQSRRLYYDEHPKKKFNVPTINLMSMAEFWNQGASAVTINN
jgi:hypothetical protein